MAIDETHLYWTDCGSCSFLPMAPAIGRVLKVPLTGGTVTTVVSGLMDPTAIAVDKSSVYWTDNESLSIMKFTPK
jgi:sugar lactone lactonase YvrE